MFVNIQGPKSIQTSSVCLIQGLKKKHAVVERYGLWADFGERHVTSTLTRLIRSALHTLKVFGLVYRRIHDIESPPTSRHIFDNRRNGEYVPPPTLTFQYTTCGILAREIPAELPVPPTIEPPLCNCHHTLFPGSYISLTLIYRI